MIVTWANDHYRDFARSWVGNLRALGLSNFMVGAMDADLHGFLRDEGVPTWLMGSRDIAKGTVERDFGWGTKTFHKMGRDKIRLIRDLTTIDGVDVLISDIDTAWLRRPDAFFRRYPDADMLVSTDQLKSETDVVPEQKAYLAKGIKGINASGTDDEGLELHICHAAMNIGVMWFRSTAGSRELTDEWVKLIEAKDELWDQNAFNDLVRLGGSCSSKPDGSGLMRGFRGKILVGALPASQFANGHVFHAQRMHSRKATDPFAVHNTFQYGGTPGKRHRMREANVWRGEDKNSRFLLKGADEETKSIGFLSYAPRIPKDVDLAIFRERSWPNARDDTFPTIESVRDPVVEAHARLVEFQLAQLRAAAAVAATLGRVVIAPPILCGLDRAWFPHFGRFPGSQFSLPFVCPLDHVLAVERSQEMDALREHSFLTGPQRSGESSKARRDRGPVVKFKRAGSQLARLYDRAGNGEGRRQCPRCADVRLARYRGRREHGARIKRSRARTRTDLTDGFRRRRRGCPAGRAVLHRFGCGGARREAKPGTRGVGGGVLPAEPDEDDAWCCAKDGHREFAVP